MESSGDLSGTDVKGNGTDNSKIASINDNAMTSLASAMKDSNCSRSLTIEISLNKLTSPSPLSSGTTKRFEKPMSVRKDGHFSCLSVSKMGEKLSISFRYEKVELVSPQEVVKPRDGNSRKKQVEYPETDTSNRMKYDARRYREWLGSRARKDMVSGSHRKQSGNNSEVCKKVKVTVVEMVDNFMGLLIDQPTPMLDPPIEPSLTSLGAAPPVKMSNHQPPAVALDSSSAIHGAQSNWVGIKQQPHTLEP
ncbi:hypothetical protein F3Y22_tig00111105pilonHSYRG00511 [Hibiscus syriacus]|uniref:Uncharacterized protein n=1 Tax=Hibiscus syriacus TaxID=106335 RepID=A0A6A2YZT6_HIBSY|nr:hypothetical protein F3Y22_tig00111105pilonHSYRG00511 [Hibiscus syriacus]